VRVEDLTSLMVHQVVPGDDLIAGEILVLPVDAGIDDGNCVVLSGVGAEVAVAVAAETEIP